MAIIALVLGIVSLCLIFVPFVGFVFPVAAAVLGFLAMRQIDQDPNLTGKGMAVAGLVLGIIFFVLFIVLMVVGLALRQWLEGFDPEGMENIAQLVLALR